MKKTEFEYLEEVKIIRKTYFIVKKNEKVGLLTSEHKVQIPVEWDEMKINNHFSLKDFLHFTIFDRNERVLVIFVKRNQKFGVIDLRGHEIIPVIYEKIEIVSFAGKFYFNVTANGNEGLVCLNENVLIPVKWEKIIPAGLSSQRSDLQFLWAGKSNFLFCFESYGDMENPIDPLIKRDKECFQFVIYNRYFELVTPEVLDGYATIIACYQLTKSFNNLAYILIRKKDRYGVLTLDARLINKLVLTYEEAIDLIRKQQKHDYINILIDYIKDNCKKINKYLEQNKKAVKTEVSPTENRKGNGLTGDSALITKDEIKNFAAVLAERLTDLKAFKLAEWAGNMEELIEKENHQAFLSIIGDLLEWLQSLKVNPELTIENRPIIEKGTDQDLQPEYNRGFAEAISNSEIESQKEL